MAHKNYKPKLNKLLEHNAKAGTLTTKKEIAILNDANKIWWDIPFCHAKNYSKAAEKLARTKIWISYGGNRTGSTFCTMAMKALLSSLTTNYLVAWEGDYKSPEKFIETVNGENCLEAGILKIHQNSRYCNSLIEEQKATAVVSTRDYRLIAASYIRMRNNKSSPFFAEGGTPERELIKYIRSQINNHREKTLIPGILFIKEKDFRINPKAGIIKISKHLGIELSEASATSLGLALRIEEQVKRQKRIELNSTGHDKNTFLHVDHISDTAYRNESIDELIMSNFENELDQEGYLKH